MNFLIFNNFKKTKKITQIIKDHFKLINMNIKI